MPQPVTLEEALARISQLENVVALKSRSITWLENKLTATENQLFYSKQSRESLLTHVADLQNKLDAATHHSDVISERLFMCEHEPSVS